MSSIKVKIIFLLFIPFFSVAQPGINFEDLILNDAILKAKAENKSVFLFGFASWCPHCAKMKAETLTDDEAGRFYNKHFICIQRDMEKGEGVELSKKFQVKSFPVWVFMDTSATVIYQITGELKPKDLLEDGKNALNPKLQLPYLKKRFESDSADAGKCYDYLMALRKGKLDYAEMIKTYMSAKKEMQLLDETNWSILANGVSDIDSDPFHFIIGYRDEYAKVISRERVMRKIVFTVNQSLNELAALSDTVSFQRQRNYAESIHEYCVDSVIFIADLLLFETTKDWNAYQKETLLNTEKYVWNDDHKLREIGNNYLKNIVDTAALLKASSWAKYALLLNSDYAGTMLAAKLFQKAGSKKESVEMAKQAKAMALQYGWNYKDADELIKHSGN